MHTLDHYFPKSKGKEFGAKYLVLDVVEKPQTRHYLNLKCKDCDYEFSQRANSVFLGVISCKCSKSYRKTKEEFYDQVQTECQQRGIELISLDYFKPLSDSRGTFKCLSCRGIWSTATSSIFTGTGCVHCVGKYQPTNEEYFDRINNALGNDFELISIEYKDRINKNSKIAVKCNSCLGVSKKKVAAVTYHDASCPCCADWGFNPNMENTLYLIKLSNHEKEFYKVGVTCKLSRRMGELSRNNNMTVEVLSHWVYPPFSPILEHESILKAHFSFGRQAGKPFPDGYTEVVDANSIPVLITIQNLQYRGIRDGLSS
jgi:ribosomal protein L44E